MDPVELYYKTTFAIYLGVALWFGDELRKALIKHDAIQKRSQEPVIRNILAGIFTLTCLFWPITLIWAFTNADKEK